MNKNSQLPPDCSLFRASFLANMWQIAPATFRQYWCKVTHTNKHAEATNTISLKQVKMPRIKHSKLKAQQTAHQTKHTRLIEQGLTSHPTHYRSHQGPFLQVIWPNRQCQSTEENQLVFQMRLESHQDHSTMLQ